jgi:hypothetical protein
MKASFAMKAPFFAAAASLALLVTGCASTARTGGGPCDTTKAVGSCAVTVQTHASKLVVCPAESATPACVSAVVNVKRPGRKAEPRQVFLQPGQCMPLPSDVESAEPAGSCEAFAPRSSGGALSASSAQ